MPKHLTTEAASASHDFLPPQIKQKKQQKEAERFSEVLMCNLILLRHLTEISMTKRVDDGLEKKMHWKDYFATIINMRKEQVLRLRRQLQTSTAAVAPAEEKQNAADAEITEEKKENGNSKIKKKKQKRVQIQ